MRPMQGGPNPKKTFSYTSPTGRPQLVSERTGRHPHWIGPYLNKQQGKGAGRMFHLRHQTCHPLGISHHRAEQNQLNFCLSLPETERAWEKTKLCKTGVRRYCECRTLHITTEQNMKNRKPPLLPFHSSGQTVWQSN